MKTKQLLQVSMVLGFGALASCSQQSSVSTTVPMSSAGSQSKSSGSDLSDRIYREVNAYRATQGASAVPRHAGLDRLAQKHSEFLMANRGKFSLHGKNVSHMGFEGRHLAARELYNMNSFSENVAACSGGSAKAEFTLVKLWADSPNHEYNMTESWTFTGVGVCVDKDGRVFSTQLFGTPSMGQMTLTDRFR